MAPLALVGFAGPPPLTPGRLLTAWGLAPVPVVALVAVAAGYLRAARSLRRRGDRWSRGRDIAFVLGGLGSIGYALSAWPGVYDTSLFWAHMVQHMVLSMVAPIFLALGAPVTLALRVLPAPGRRILTRTLHSIPAKIIMNPAVGAGLLFGTPFVLYFTGLYPHTLWNATLHQLLHVHFVVAGCIFFWPLVGVDPVPGRLAHPLRLLLLFVTLPAHAWLGISIMSSKTVLGLSYYLAHPRHWGPSLLSDQSIGGAVLWAAGDLVGLIVVAALFVQWSRADEREALRTDRRLDRAGLRELPVARTGTDSGSSREAREAGELAAYNARLAALAKRDADHR